MVANFILKFVKRSDNKLSFVLLKNVDEDGFNELIRITEKIKQDGFNVGGLTIQDEKIFIHVSDKFGNFDELDVKKFYRMKLYSRKNNEYVNIKVSTRLIEVVEILENETDEYFS